jgi:hypothetical protein
MGRKLVSIFILFGLFSCDRTESTQADSKSFSDSTGISIMTSLSGQVYLYAPEIDSLTCEATGACDCCSGNLIFLNDSAFISMDYCESSTSYSKGTYQFLNGNLVITTDSISISKEYNPAKEADTTGKVWPDYIVTDTTLAPYKQTLKRISCKKNICFLMSDEETYYVTPDRKSSLTDLIKNLQDDNIWEKLKIKNYH